MDTAVKALRRAIAATASDDASAVAAAAVKTFRKAAETVQSFRIATVTIVDAVRTLLRAVAGFTFAVRTFRADAAAKKQLLLLLLLLLLLYRHSVSLQKLYSHSVRLLLRLSLLSKHSSRLLLRKLLLTGHSE